MLGFSLVAESISELMKDTHSTAQNVKILRVLQNFVNGNAETMDDLLMGFSEDLGAKSSLKKALDPMETKVGDFLFKMGHKKETHEETARMILENIKRRAETEQRLAKEAMRNSEAKNTISIWDFVFGMLGKIITIAIIGFISRLVVGLFS